MHHHLGDNVFYGQTSTRILSSLYDVAFGKWVVEFLLLFLLKWVGELLCASIIVSLMIW